MISGFLRKFVFWFFSLFLPIFVEGYLLFSLSFFICFSLSFSLWFLFLHLPLQPQQSPWHPGKSLLWPHWTLSEIGPVPLWQVLSDSCCPHCCGIQIPGGCLEPADGLTNEACSSTGICGVPAKLVGAVDHHPPEPSFLRRTDGRGRWSSSPRGTEG